MSGLFDATNQQHFLFDFVLQKAEALSETISEESIAVTCEQRDKSPYKVPKLDEIIKLIDKTAYSIDKNKLVSDIFECGAIAISNNVDLTQFDKREARYLEIIRSYRHEEQKAIADIFGLIFALLSSMTYSTGCFDDYLGKLFMGLKLGNDRNSQFFTPYHVSKMCAKMTLEEDLIREKARTGEILTLNEPCCGAGGMALAAMDVLYNDYKFNYASNCLVVCEDIDIRGVRICVTCSSPLQAFPQSSATPTPFPANAGANGERLRLCFSIRNLSDFYDKSPLQSQRGFYK